MANGNSKNPFGAIESFFRNAAPWSYIGVGLVGWGLIMAFFFLGNSDSTPSKGPSKAKTGATESASPSPKALTVTRPLNGETLTEREPAEGLHEYIIENNGDNDAIVKLIDATTGKTYRHSYVHSKRALELKNVRDGVFQIKFSTGSDYSPETKLFTKDQRYLLFSENEEFLTIRKGDKAFWSRRGVVLFPAKGGNARLYLISEAEFADKEEPVPQQTPLPVN